LPFPTAPKILFVQARERTWLRVTDKLLVGFGSTGAGQEPEPLLQRKGYSLTEGVIKIRKQSLPVDRRG